MRPILDLQILGINIDASTINIAQCQPINSRISDGDIATSDINFTASQSASINQATCGYVDVTKILNIVIIKT
ncbi:hypothetical protein [Microcoleus sp.]|uniref:hypothetical protein n=1 Tax=Microcoleus sp. TaxID=44472 RepID=UPI0035248F16